MNRYEPTTDTSSMSRNDTTGPWVRFADVEEMATKLSEEVTERRSLELRLCDALVDAAQFRKQYRDLAELYGCADVVLSTAVIDDGADLPYTLADRAKVILGQRNEARAERDIALRRLKAACYLSADSPSMNGVSGPELDAYADNMWPKNEAVG